jgi:phosphomannomutase
MTSLDDVVATSVVSSSLLEKMANAAHVRCVETLTGFKWIARAAGDGVLRFGYEEALGFAVDPLVPDKDGMSAALALSQLAHRLDQAGLSVFDRLDEIESTFGVHAGAQFSLRAQGAGSMASLESAFTRFLDNPPSSLGGFEVSECVDLMSGWIGLTPTPGLILKLGERGSVVVRPSGTEPKLKAYLEILGEHPSDRPLSEQRDLARAQLSAVRQDLERLLRI